MNVPKGATHVSNNNVYYRKALKGKLMVWSGRLSKWTGPFLPRDGMIIDDLKIGD